MNEDMALAAFSALSDKTRLRIVRTLIEAGPDGLPAGAIATMVGASPSRASFHLAALTKTGLITDDRQSRHIIYSPAFDQLGALVSYFLEDCCKGHPAVRACC